MAFRMCALFSLASLERNCIFFFKKKMKFISKPNQPNLLVYIVKSVRGKSMFNNFYTNILMTYAEMANDIWHFFLEKKKHFYPFVQNEC